MNTKYIKVTAVATTQAINAHLEQGWEILTSQFCPVDQLGPNGGRGIIYVPHALLGLPSDVADRLLAENVAARAWTATEPRMVTDPGEPEPEPTPAPPEPVPVPQAEQPIMSRPSPPRGAAVFNAPVDLNRSEETMVGVRRR